jgi:DNA-binding transcriptional regulator YiaG
MLNLNTALNERIARVARKEIRARVGSTKRLATSHRRDVAALKRQVKELTRRLALLEAISAKAVKSLPVPQAENIRFSARSVLAQRKRLGLSAGDFGRLVGVSGLSIYNYEQGKSRPRQAQIAKLAAIRGIGKKEALQRLEMLGGE